METLQSYENFTTCRSHKSPNEHVPHATLFGSMPSKVLDNIHRRVLMECGMFIIQGAIVEVAGNP